jgi:hypothetical protein
MGRYIRIHSLVDNEHIINLQEVQAFDASGRLLQPVGAELSSVQSVQQDASKCIDGADAVNFCQSASFSDKAPWLRIDYGSNVLIAEIVVTNRPNPNMQGRIAGATISVTSDAAGKKATWVGTLKGTRDAYTMPLVQACQPIAARGGSCLCDFTIETEPIYVATNKQLPTEEELRASLFQATVAPADFGKDVYTKCTTRSCTSRNGIAVYTKSSTATPSAFDIHTIFEITTAAGDRHGRKNAKYLFNKQSIVHVGTAAGDARWTFRNPPNFVPNIGVHAGHPGGAESWQGGFSPFGNAEIWATAANYETNALIEHLFQHDNTPPFVHGARFVAGLFGCSRMRNWIPLSLLLA